MKNSILKPIIIGVLIALIAAGVGASFLNRSLERADSIVQNAIPAFTPPPAERLPTPVSRHTSKHAKPAKHTRKTHTPAPKKTH